MNASQFKKNHSAEVQKSGGGPSLKYRPASVITGAGHYPRSGCLALPCMEPVCTTIHRVAAAFQLFTALRGVPNSLERGKPALDQFTDRFIL